MTEEDWNAGFARSLAVFLNGDAIAAPGPRGERILDASFYAVFNAYEGDLEFTLPADRYGTRWVPIIDTAAATVDQAFPDERRVTLETVPAGHTFTVAGRSTRLLRRASLDD
jgi:glycogen operon protein